MCGQEDVAAALEAEALEDGGAADLFEIGAKDFGHRRAGDVGALFRHALAVQVPARVLAVAHVDVRDVVDDAAVGLFRQALVEAAVARFHVEERDVQALGGIGREAGVRIAQDEDRVRLQFDHQRITAGDDIADRRAQIFADYFEEVIRRPEPEVVEEDLVQFVIVILARMHEDLVEVRVALLDYGGEPDDLGPCADDSHKFEFCHITPLRSTCRAYWGRSIRLPT